MSHITRIKTAVTKASILKQTLVDLNLPWTEFDKESSKIELDRIVPDDFPIEFAVVQENGTHIMFLWSGKSYELNVDVSTWDQDRSISDFMGKIEHHYSLLLVKSIINESRTPELDSCNENREGKNTRRLRQTIDGSLKTVQLVKGVDYTSSVLRVVVEPLGPG